MRKTGYATTEASRDSSRRAGAERSPRITFAAVKLSVAPSRPRAPSWRLPVRAERRGDRNSDPTQGAQVAHFCTPQTRRIGARSGAGH
jgi:hypothetical protein